MKSKLIISLVLAVAFAAQAEEKEKPRQPDPDEGLMTIVGRGNSIAKSNLAGIKVNTVMRCFKDREVAENKYRTLLNKIVETLEEYKGNSNYEYVLSGPGTIDSDMTEKYTDFSQKNKHGIPIEVEKEYEACKHVSGANDTITLITRQVEKIPQAIAAVKAAAKGLVSNKPAGDDITDSLSVIVENPSYWITEDGVQQARKAVYDDALANHDAQKKSIEHQCLVLEATRQSPVASDPQVEVPEYFSAVAPVSDTISLDVPGRANGIQATPASAAGVELKATFSATYKIRTADHCAKK